MVRKNDVSPLTVMLSVKPSTELLSRVKDDNSDLATIMAIRNNLVPEYRIVEKKPVDYDKLYGHLIDAPYFGSS